MKEYCVNSKQNYSHFKYSWAYYACIKLLENSRTTFIGRTRLRLKLSQLQENLNKWDNSCYLCGIFGVNSSFLRFTVLQNTGIVIVHNGKLHSEYQVLTLKIVREEVRNTSFFREEGKVRQISVRSAVHFTLINIYFEY